MVYTDTANNHTVGQEMFAVVADFQKTANIEYISANKILIVNLQVPIISLYGTWQKGESHNCCWLDKMKKVQNPRKYYVRKLEFSAIHENIMSAKLFCPTVV